MYSQISHRHTSFHMRTQLFSSFPIGPSSHSTVLNTLSTNNSGILQISQHYYIGAQTCFAKEMCTYSVVQMGIEHVPYMDNPYNINYWVPRKSPYTSLSNSYSSFIRKCAYFKHKRQSKRVFATFLSTVSEIYSYNDLKHE